MQDDAWVKSERRTKRATQRMAAAVDVAWLSDTIGAVYDCSIRPGGWCAALTDIARKLEFDNAVLGIARFREPTGSILVNAGVDAEYEQKFPSYLADSIELWGGQKVVDDWPIEEPAIASQIIPLERKRQNRYYVDLLEPRGFTDGVVLPIAREPDMFCSIGFNRHFSVGDVSIEVVTALRLLAPHLRRAVTISNLLDLKAVESGTFESVLSALAHGVVLVTEHLRIVHANPIALQLIARNQVVGVKNGNFVAHGLHAQSALQMAVKLAAENESLMSRRGIGVPSQGLDGTTAVLHVLPLRKGMIRPGLVQSAVAAVFVTTPDQSVQVPVDAISLLFDLTPAEAQIFGSLAQARTLDQTAEALGIAKSTARTHLLRIFEKTGCKRQAELVALAARHATPV